MKKSLLSLIIFFLAILFYFNCNGDLLEEGPDATSADLDVKYRGIWIIGGAANIAGTSIYSQLDLYDPVTNTWYPDIAANASGSYTPTAFNMVVSMNGKIYVIGGAASSGAATYAVFEYDIANNSWTDKRNIQYTGVDTALMASTAYTYAGSIYLLGGTTTTSTAGNIAYHLRFNPAAGVDGTWYNTPPALYPLVAPEPTTARSSIGSSSIGGITYYFGGRIVAGTAQSTSNAYIIATDGYSAITETPLTTARSGMACAHYSGTSGTYIFLVGGATAFSSVAAYFSTTPTYVVQTNCFLIYSPGGGVGTITLGKFHPTFSGGATTGIVFSSAAVSPYNGSSTTDPTLYVFGGIRNQSTVTDEVWSITANDTLGGYPTATWYSKINMPRARYGFTAITINQ